MTATAPARIAPTDADEFTALYQQHREKIYHIVCKLVRRKNDREDILQDVFMLAFAHRHQFDGRSPYSSWLTRIAINRSFSYLRKLQAQPLCFDSDLPATENGSAWSSVPDTRRNIEDAAVDHELVAKLLAALPPDSREIVRMRYFEGLGQDEISTHFGLTLSGCRVKMLRTRRNLLTRAVALSTARRTGAKV